MPDRARPPKVCGVVPDIYARKRKKLIVEEIETKGTLKSDEKHQIKLKNGTKELGGVFKIKVTK